MTSAFRAHGGGSDSLDDTHRGFEVVPESHFRIQTPRAGVVSHDVQVGAQSALQVPTHEFQRELAREAAPLEIRVRADAADFAQPGRFRSLAGHRNQPAILTVTEDRKSTRL